jgi:uncharacterized membrane protein
MSTSAQIAIGLAAFLCSLVAGFLFAFAVVIMPGIRSLPDREFLRAFQRVDGIIQEGQPLFGMVWLGSTLALVLGLALGLGHLSGLERALLVTAAGVYILGVQLPTFVVNVPLNNELQGLDVDGDDIAGRRKARERFEPRWNRWNGIRTALAALTTAMLLVLLIRI